MSVQYPVVPEAIPASSEFRAEIPAEPIGDSGAPAAPPPAGAAADGGATGAPQDPRLVIRGERLEEEKYPESGERIGLSSRGKVVFIPVPKPDANPCSSITDWLNVTFPFRVSDEAIRDLRLQVTANLDERLGGLKERKGGMHGYQRSFDFDGGGAKFACGGQSGTGFLSFPGDACALIHDWSRVVAFLRDVLQARITRWDGAVDDYQGHHSVDEAVDWYQRGGFNAGGSNHPAINMAIGSNQMAEAARSMSACEKTAR
jgi:phage replication initiation protein